MLTPVPLHYARHTSRLATVFVSSLPLVLARELGLALVPTMGFISWALFGIQEIGLLIEDPFRTVLKLDAICMSIQRDVQQTLDASMTVHLANDEDTDLDATTEAAPAAADGEATIDAIDAPASPSLVCRPLSQ